MNYTGISGAILNIAILVTAYAVIILGLLYAWNFIFEYLLTKVLKQMKLYTVFVEFIFERARLKRIKNNEAIKNKFKQTQSV
jgi:hypothetical protein